MNNTLLQPAAFLAMLYGGAAGGIIYDLFRVIRRIFHSRVVNIISDALFLACGVCIAVLSFLFASGGTIRPYLCFGLVIGFFIQQWSVSFLFFRVFYRLRTRFLKG